MLEKPSDPEIIKITHRNIKIRLIGSHINAMILEVLEKVPTLEKSLLVLKSHTLRFVSLVKGFVPC